MSPISNRLTDRLTHRHTNRQEQSKIFLIPLLCITNITSKTPIINLATDIIQICLVSRVTLRNGKPKRSASGDIDIESLPFLKVTPGPRHYLFCYSRQFYFFMNISISLMNCRNKFLESFICLAANHLSDMFFLCDGHNKF